MIVDIDFKQLELVCAFFLSKDEIGYREIETGFDIHSDNQQRFGLPERLVAKTFAFRLIYGGSAFAYGSDPDFNYISKSSEFWQDIIDRFYAKYKGLKRWHTSIVQEVIRNGKLVIPSGREFHYTRINGEWPRTIILNYPVQGLGADIMTIARISLYRRLMRSSLKAKLICTVHDSIVLDAPSAEIPMIKELANGVWTDLPRNFERAFGVKFDLPVRFEMKAGPDWGNMVEV